MNIVWAALLITVTAAIGGGAMLLVRRKAPEGSYFADSDRAAGILGVLATGFRCFSVSDLSWLRELRRVP